MLIKKICVTANGKVEFIEVELPAVEIAADEIEGRAVYSAVSPGTETAGVLQQGLFRSFKLPISIGYAMVFRVEKCGANVKDFKPGNLAFCMSNHQSYHRLKAVDCVKVPEELEAVLSPFARLLGISMCTLATTPARPPNKVMITGLGIVGNLAAQVFLRCGYDVYAVDPSEARRKIAVSCGIKKVLPFIDPKDKELNEKVQLVVECSGHEKAVVDALNIVAKRGEVVLLGVPWVRKTDIFAYDAFYAIFHKYAVLRSGWEWEVPIQPAQFNGSSMMENFTGALNWLKEGSISPKGLYDIAKPADASKIYDNYLKGKAAHLTTVFDWSGV